MEGVISIHTPTKGVTWKRFSNGDLLLWFQSTLPQREWRKRTIYIGWGGSDFNPHSHKGSDDCCVVSAPCFLHFNPHSHKGSDNPEIFLLLRPFTFQSTLPQREWRQSHRNLDHGFYFNPHSHKGSDLICFNFSMLSKISIHTPTKGVTTFFCDWRFWFRFQSTLPQREWLIFLAAHK